MTAEASEDPLGLGPGGGDLVEIELSDDDVLDAMRRIPGYLDISTEDFRAIYRLAHAHALERMFRGVRAEALMRTGIEPLVPDMPLDAAAKAMARQRSKGLPVVDPGGYVVGMLTETDFLRRLRAETFVELLLRLVEDQGNFMHRCHESLVGDAMTAAPVTIATDAGCRAIASAFHAHAGRSMPVVDAEGRLRGLLLRKDFVKAYPLEALL